MTPLYALPQGDAVNWEMLLEEGSNTHRLAFVSLADLLLFQQALTGYKAVDDYAEYDASLDLKVLGFAN